VFEQPNYFTGCLLDSLEDCSFFDLIEGCEVRQKIAAGGGRKVKHL
jgi:hypothetical protein